MNLGLIGCGFMGEALLSATIARGVLSATDVRVAEVNDDRCAFVTATYGVFGRAV